MKLTPLLAALAFALSASAAHAIADGNCATVLNTPDGFLNLRSAPMVKSNVIARLRPGDLLYINSAECETKGSLSICSQDWTSVDAVARLNGTDFSKPGHRGWVYSRYLRSAGECPEPATSKPTTAASVLGQSTTDPTLWHHNGSVVQLVAKRLSREFYYQEPRAGMLEAGAQVGSLLFKGHTKNGWYSGTAFIFDRHCGQFPYEVSGPILDNYTRVQLTGQAPRIGPNCGVQGYWTDTLEFTLLKSGEAAKLGSADRKRSDAARFFSGKCRGFPERQQIGMLVEPPEEIERIIEGEGYVSCKLVPGSAAENRIAKGCSYGSPCEIDAKLRVNQYDVDIVDIQSLKSWEGWKGTCYGRVTHEGDGYYSVGTIDVQTPNKVNTSVRCDFFLFSVSNKILMECLEGSICEVKARFERKPEVPLIGDAETVSATIGYVDSVKMREPPNNTRNFDSYTEPIGTSTPLGLCSVAIKDPLRQMIIDELISGGKHVRSGNLNQVKIEIENDYGSFLNVRDDATVEQVDQLTGKIGCAVTYEADLQGLTAKVVRLGATARAQILLRQMAQVGNVLRRRLEYTVQKTSGGSFVVWWGLPTDATRRAGR